MPDAIAMRHRAPHFQHVFSHGYSSGYYCYLWSEVLDADGFEAFEEAGDIFDPPWPGALNDFVYAAGGNRDYEAAYLPFVAARRRRTPCSASAAFNAGRPEMARKAQEDGASLGSLFKTLVRRSSMTDITAAGAFPLGDRTVNRMGYGAMQLAGPGVFGPPKDRDAALAVLREAVASGVNHIDTSDFYGPYVTNQLIREALHPYPDDLVIVTKVGAVRGDDASWNPAIAPADLVERRPRQPAQPRPRRAGRRQPAAHGRRPRAERGIDRGAVHRAGGAAAQGLIRHLGLSNVTSAQVAEARGIAEVVCVQNLYNVAHRADDPLIDELAGMGIAYVPFFPLGGFTPLQSSTLSDVAARAWRDADAGGARLAASPRAQHPPDPGHLVARPPAREPQGGRAQAFGRSALEARCNGGRECSVSATAASRTCPASSPYA